MQFNNFIVKDGQAVPEFTENETLEYGFESFLFDYTDSERTKILKLHGHERIVDTATTINSTYKLKYHCHSNGACSNCSGVRCSAIFVKNPKLEAFEAWKQSHTYFTNAKDGVYAKDRFEDPAKQMLNGDCNWIYVPNESKIPSTYATRLFISLKK